MYLFQCMNPDCFDASGTFTFESKKPICPQCKGIPPDIGTVALIHFGYYDKTGQLKGFKGRKFRIACGGHFTIGPWHSISSYLYAVNCPRCKESEIYKALWEPDPDNPASYFAVPEEKDNT
jgi:hypothetical protein